MKLLYIHQHFTTRAGATGTRSYEFARELVKRGHDVTLICGAHLRADAGITGPIRFGRREGVIDGIKIIQIVIPYSNYDSFYRRLWKFAHFSLISCWLALRLHYDLIFTTSTPLTVGLPGLVAKILRGKKFIFEVRDVWPELAVQMGVLKNKMAIRFLEWFELTCYRKADHCIALSPGIKKAILRSGICEDRVSLIPNGCDLELFDPGRSIALPRALAESPFDLDNDMIAVFAGEHGPANGLETVIQAARIVEDRGFNAIKFLFIGNGRAKKGLQDLAFDLKLKNTFFWDPLPKNELAAIVPRLHLGLMILANKPGFYYGTSPNKFFDYLASGLPVLTNYPGWVADLVTNHHCGRACPPEDAETMAETLIELFLKREERKQMSHASRALGESHFDRTKLADQFIEALENTSLES